MGLTMAGDDGGQTTASGKRVVSKAAKALYYRRREIDYTSKDHI